MVLSRYARIIANNIFGEPPKPVSQEVTETDESAFQFDDPLKDVLDFEFNKPKPKKIADPYGLDLEAIAREAIEEGWKPPD